MRRTLLAAAAATLTVAAGAPLAHAATTPADDAAVAYNIIPSGEPGGFPFPAGATTQAQMYNALTPLFDHVTNADIATDFKSEGFGVGPDGPATVEPVPYPGVEILRDRFDVPHVTATTHDGGVWAAGWIAAQDRGLLLSQARYDSLVAAIDAPGLSAIGLVDKLDQFQPSAQTERVVARQTQQLLHHGAAGRAVYHDIQVYCDGINAYLKSTDSSEAPFTPVDIYAFNALKDQFFGEGGGNQAQNSELLAGLERRLGTDKGYSVFSDLTQNLNAGSPTTVDGTYDYDRNPTTPNSPGSVLLSPGSYHSSPSVPAKVAEAIPNTEPRHHASNELMVEGRYSATGHPLLVGGPQVGYFYPGLTFEIDMHAPGLDWRGATSANLPGYLLIGRGSNFATTLTSAGADDTDEFAETLCGHSRVKYLYDGRCRSMQRFNAGTLITAKGARVPVRFETTVNGPVIGYARVGRHEVAIAQKRASEGKDTLDLLYNRELSDGQVHSPRTFIRAAEQTPQTFNSFYVDDRHVAEITTGLLPLRAAHTNPALPTVGNGRYEWRGYLSAKGHPQGVDPQHTPVKGTMVNWNNVSAHGFGAAPDDFGGNGSAARVQLLNAALRGQRHDGKWTMAGVVSAMNEAATQDVRERLITPLLVRLLRGSHAPNSQAAAMLRTLVAWNRAGGNVLPSASNSAQIANPGAAVMAAAYPKLADAVMRPLLGTRLLSQLDAIYPSFDGYLSGQYSGWYQYMDRDFLKLLHVHQPQPLANGFCGRGSLKACRRSLWAAMAAAGRQLTRSQHTSNPADWHASATAIQIHFSPLNVFTMQYTNRPSGIQQVISFDRH